jgi:2',3'-cyclic-nucleotide 2'-phosphodiesterase (5'-nucleotidase family)
VRNGYDNVLVVDAGNSLFHRVSLSSISEEEERVGAALVARAMKEINYDVVNVGPTDLAAGLDFFKEVMESAPFTIVSANILSVETAEFVFEPYVIKEVGGVTVGFFGVMGGGVSGAHDVMTFVITDPKKAAEMAIEDLQKGCDLVVGLLAMDRREANEFAEEVTGIDLIITTSEPRPIPIPTQVGKTVMVSGDEKGKRIGRVTVTMGSGGPYSFEGGMIPAGSLVYRDVEVRKVENEFYYWLREHNPGAVILDP